MSNILFLVYFEYNMYYYLDMNLTIPWNIPFAIPGYTHLLCFFFSIETSIKNYFKILVKNENESTYTDTKFVFT